MKFMSIMPLITKIKQNKLIYKLNHHQYTLKIKVVIQDDYQEACSLLSFIIQ